MPSLSLSIYLSFSLRLAKISKLILLAMKALTKLLLLLVSLRLLYCARGRVEGANCEREGAAAAAACQTKGSRDESRGKKEEDADVRGLRCCRTSESSR